MKSFNLSEWALGHRAIVLFLILAVAVAGVLSLTRLGQLEDPNFSVPSMTALVIWPGATAQQMQDEVLNRMEKKFEQLDHFEKVVTYARQGYGAMTISVAVAPNGRRRAVTGFSRARYVRVCGAACGDSSRRTTSKVSSGSLASDALNLADLNDANCSSGTSTTISGST